MIPLKWKYITDGLITLREITMEDALLLYQFRIDEATREMFMNNRVFSKKQHLNFMEKYFLSENTDCWWVIECEGEIIGSFAIQNIDKLGKKGETGRLAVSQKIRKVRRETKGKISVKNIIVRASKLRGKAAKEMGLNYLYAYVLESNKAVLTIAKLADYDLKGIKKTGNRNYYYIVLDLKKY